MSGRPAKFSGVVGADGVLAIEDLVGRDDLIAWAVERRDDRVGIVRCLGRGMPTGTACRASREVG
jgi:hypothetical protein